MQSVTELSLRGAGVMLINNEVIEHIYDENSVENKIIEALRDNRVEVFYQPIITLKRINSPLRRRLSE